MSQPATLGRGNFGRRLFRRPYTPHIERVYYLCTKTTPTGSIAYLYQRDEFTREFIIEQTWSWRFHRAQLKYTLLERELCGIVHATTHLERTIYFHRTYLHVDRETYQMAKFTQRTNPRISRWMDYIESLNYTIVHAALAENPRGPEALRRIHLPFTHWGEGQLWRHFGDTDPVH